MATYNVQGWVFSGSGPVTLQPVTISDDDPQLSPYATDDLTETITINGTTYTNPRAATYQLTFTDSDGLSHTEDFLRFTAGGVEIFVPLPGSEFDTGSVITGYGGYQNHTTGFAWDDVTCFAAGTLIQTESGARQIETIRIGDQIETPAGSSDVVWIGRRSFSSAVLAENPKLRPIRIMAGALGNGLPKRDLLVSRQHRMLVRSKIAQRMFATSEVLIPAIKLTALPGIFVDDSVQSVTYFHLLFKRHEVIFAEGAATESMFTGPEAMKSVRPEAREEILSIFPEVADLDYAPEPARPIPPGKQQKQLVARHLKNGQPLTHHAV